MAGNFYSTFKGVPIDYLIATPLIAAARGNLALASVMEEFIYTLGYKEGKPGGEPNLITFQLTHPYEDNDSGEMKSQTITVNASLLGIVPIPALLVDNVSIDFTTTVSTSSSSSANVDASISAKYGFGAFSVSGKVSTQASHTRQSNQSATYKFHVEAQQQPPTEGRNE